jgi:putative acetyltransferase
VAVRLRAYRASDLETTLDLWQRAWDTAMPEIDFSARLDWWRKRWTHEIVPANTIFVAHAESTVVGFLVLDELTG